MDECSKEFKKLLIKCNIQEPEWKTIVRYLGDIDPKYSNIVKLQQFTTFDEVCVLAHKVKQQRKNKPYKCELPKPQAKNLPFNKGSFN